MIEQAKTELRSPVDARRLHDRLTGFRQQTEFDIAEVAAELKAVRNYLSISNRVTDALETLSHKLFHELLELIEGRMTVALQEVLEQPIRLKAEATWKNKAASVDFFVERDGNREDILKGQGGSVTNIVSVGLRMFALATLPKEEHRPFLVLDEQDCWLRPDLVPRLVKIVYDAGKTLGFQVLMISHHDPAIFEQYADRIYRLRPGPNGVADVELVKDTPVEEDSSD